MAEVAEDLGRMSSGHGGVCGYRRAADGRAVDGVVAPIRPAGSLVSPRGLGSRRRFNLEARPGALTQSRLSGCGRHPVLVLPGFYGINTDGETVLFGRGGSTSLRS